MSLQIASIASGSNGNCYYVGNAEEAVLIDAGISCRETEGRMQRLQLPIQRVKAIFISHEHSDHIKGVSVLARKYNLPVYVTPGTAHGGRLNLAVNHTIPFEAHSPVQIGKLSVIGFKKHHDAWDPHSFIIEQDGVTIGVFTDLGQVCDGLIQQFRKCHAAFLETNYDEDMLLNGRYPYHLKARIRGGKGHLSNRQALDLFRSHRPKHMSHLLLSHLSKDNNDPDLALELFQQHAKGVNICVASRHQECGPFTIHANASTMSTAIKAIFNGVPQSAVNDQLSLF